MARNQQTDRIHPLQLQGVSHKQKKDQKTRSSPYATQVFLDDNDETSAMCVRRKRKTRKLDEQEQPVPTMTLPNLPLRSWWPNGNRKFHAPDEVKVIILEIDGYRLERDPVFDELVSDNRVDERPGNPQLKPVVVQKEDWDVPKLLLSTVKDADIEERRDSVVSGAVFDPNATEAIRELQKEFGELF